MERLLPDRDDGSLADLYADLVVPAGDERPHVYVGMVASVDGAAVLDGRSTGLGGEADRAAFRRLRETCDAILVGAGTVRAEGYRPPGATDDVVTRRTARGLTPRATIAVVTGSGALDPASRLFSDPTYRPLLLTTPHADVAALEPVADVVRSGDARVDLAAALRALRTRGVRRLLCEGGPTLNAALLRAGLVDELFLTVTPTLVGASPLRILDGALPDPVGVELLELRHHRGELLLRYRVATRAPAGNGHPATGGGPR